MRTEESNGDCEYLTTITFKTNRFLSLEEKEAVDRQLRRLVIQDSKFGTGMRVYTPLRTFDNSILWEIPD